MTRPSASKAVVVHTGFSLCKGRQGLEDLYALLTTITTPDNALVSTSYSGNAVTVTDKVLRSRKSQTDALAGCGKSGEHQVGAVKRSTKSHEKTRIKASISCCFVWFRGSCLFFSSLFRSPNERLRGPERIQLSNQLCLRRA